MVQGGQCIYEGDSPVNRDLENWVNLVDGVDELREVAQQLEPHARECLLRLARRFLAGQRQYGTLDLADDKQKRNMLEEAAQEAVDNAAYLEFLLKQLDLGVAYFGAKHG